jgi:2,3-bisphosphoglycerate-dependent phosphoglycerate mutase
MNRLLVLARHGQSEWNLKNLFTGWKDPGLTDLGIEEARNAGRRLKEMGVQFDIAFTSDLSRAQRTCKLILEEIGQPDLRTIANQALNERDYGDLSGLNKDDARARWGEEQVHVWRRSYDVPPPGGESLKDTVARVLPYYIREILPRVMRGERVLVAAHGNSLRALVMVLDGLTSETIPSLEHDGRQQRSAGGVSRPSSLFHVVAGLVPAISILRGSSLHAIGITGTRPVMT